MVGGDGMKVRTHSGYKLSMHVWIWARMQDSCNASSLVWCLDTGLIDEFARLWRSLSPQQSRAVGPALPQLYGCVAPAVCSIETLCPTDLTLRIHLLPPLC